MITHQVLVYISWTQSKLCYVMLVYYHGKLTLCRIKVMSSISSGEVRVKAVELPPKLIMINSIITLLVLLSRMVGRSILKNEIKTWLLFITSAPSLSEVCYLQWSLYYVALLSRHPILGEEWSILPREIFVPILIKAGGCPF